MCLDPHISRDVFAISISCCECVPMDLMPRRIFQNFFLASSYHHLHCPFLVWRLWAFVSSFVLGWNFWVISCGHQFSSSSRWMIVGLPTPIRSELHYLSHPLTIVFYLSTSQWVLTVLCSSSFWRSLGSSLSFAWFPGYLDYMAMSPFCLILPSVFLLVKLNLVFDGAKQLGQPGDVDLAQFPLKLDWQSSLFSLYLRQERQLNRQVLNGFGSWCLSLCIYDLIY